MNFEKSKSKEIPKKEAWFTVNAPGHEGEYLLHLENCDIDHFIPKKISDEIQKELGKDWAVSNRGTRLEITNLKDIGFVRRDEEVYNAVAKVLGDKYKTEKP